MGAQLRIAGIIKESIVDGPGIRMVVFAQGCKHNCPGCHNPETHSFNGGKLIDTDEIIEEAKRNPLLDGITFSGGEPFEQAEAFAELAEKAHKSGLNVMAYTGYTYEHLSSNTDKNPGWKKLLSRIELLVDGRYEQDKRSLMLKFRGSTNQRIIDMVKTRISNEIVLAAV